jgi:hypothetical protein
MACSAYINRWIVGALLSVFVLTVQSLSAHDSAVSPNQSQSVYLRLTSDDAEVVSEFTRRLTQYDGVRRRLDASLPPLVVSADPATTRRVAEAHHGALLLARDNARQGDIFFDRIADMFRDWISDSLHDIPANVFIAMITEPDAAPLARPYVNGSYPDGAALTTMPPDLLLLFPALPAGLEYRFVDRDLILWDPHANLIVDFIPDALPLSPPASRRK